MYSFTIEAEQPADANAIEHLLDLSFGLSRRTKTSYRLREGSMTVPGLSLVVRDADVGLAGAISFWPLSIGRNKTTALLLGPLAVHPQRQNLGIGIALMRQSLAEATRQGYKLVLLVGDRPYYERVGFQQAPEGRFILPGPVNPKRVLYLELTPGALDKASGLVLPSHRNNQIAQ
jgi:predicted N-acetyltransferase YhbS